LLEDAHRRHWAFVLATTVRVTRDLDVAEECVQDAFARAVTAWRDAPPDNPRAWLTAVARNRALDVVRREITLRNKLPLLVEPPSGPDPADEFPDDRLRLIFTCCHPALAPEGQVALTLRLLCGLSTPEVARAFLVTESTMAARITRAKKKIAAARIPYRVPPRESLPERVDAVLAVIHLLHTTGHSAPSGASLTRADLLARAEDLARLLHGLLPSPATAGLLALVVLNGSRSRARTDRDGRLVLLEHQDRTQWDEAAIAEGLSLVREGLSTGQPSRYALQAAIAAVHAEAARYEDTDWREIAALYAVLAQRWPTPVVALNHAVAVGLAEGPAEGLAALDRLAEEPALATYPYLPAARADFLRRLHRMDEAGLAYQEALLLTDNAVEREFLEERLKSL
jgi:RNA polymerase sigma factor (sigma-70 family)